VACLAVLAGCSLTKPQPPKPTKQPLTAEQSAWWSANQHRKQYVKGRGYYVEGESGFFDHEGRRIQGEYASATVEEEGILDRLAPKRTFTKFKSAIGQGPNEKTARLAMDEGDTLFRQKKYAPAAKSYRKAYKGWPDSPLEEEALFKTAESEFFADHYSKAEDEYGLLIKKYPSTQYISQIMTRRFAIGRYWEQYDRAHPRWPITPNLFDKTRPRFDTAGHALKVYERIRLDDPTGPLSDDAVMATANAHFIKGHWEEADYHYGLLRSEFPKSEHQFQAHLLGLRCKLLRYQGPGYEGAPLDEAEDLATQLITQFSHELGPERERVVGVRADIRHQRALRDFELAEYYDTGKYFGASRMYYDRIAKEYPDTRLAAESRKRLDTIKDLPATPEQPLDWLVAWLPKSKREGPSLPKDFSPTPVSVANRSDSANTK
jgi:outer membrane protein assembly factor BamD (BamD/ComL family)